MRASWTSRVRFASSAAVGGSLWRWRSECRTTPIWVETCAVEVTSSVEPPPMSMTRNSPVAAVRRAVVGQLGLLVAAEGARARSRARRWTRAANARAVGGVADGRGHHRGGALAAVVGDRRRGSRAGRRARAAGRRRRGGRCASTPSPRRVTIERARELLRRLRRSAGGSSWCRCRPRRRGSRRRVRHRPCRRARRAGCRRPCRPSASGCGWWPQPTCGTTSRLGAVSSGSSFGSGSGSVTSRPAPAISPASSASRSATWSTTPPRAVLIR